jgi:hypothetical protein
MELFDITYIMNNVDYSFGDQASMVHNLDNSYMKKANIHNHEFIEFCKTNTNKVITLFIDNIRLYKRKIIRYTYMETVNTQSFNYKNHRIEELKEDNLLELCSLLTDNRFLIFTGFEDTPVDEEIFDNIPSNVLGIYSSNATNIIDFNNKVKPIGYGLQRKLYNNDNRHEILLNNINNTTEPINLLYINHNIHVNNKRSEINQLFTGNDWVTIRTPNNFEYNNYSNYLNEIKQHKFMICCDGNAIGCDCHRDWEVLYMKRVPIVKNSEYLQIIFKDLPVLFVDSFEEINEVFLIKNEYLYQQALNLDINLFDIKIKYDNIINKYK